MLRHRGARQDASMARAWTLTVRQRDGVLTGLAQDVDDTGRLLLRTDDGVLHTLAEGDVTLVG